MKTLYIEFDFSFGNYFKFFEHGIYLVVKHYVKWNREN